jgi:hypothetical protein
MVARKATADVPSYAESRGRTPTGKNGGVWLEFGLEAVKVLDRKCRLLKPPL